MRASRGPAETKFGRYALRTPISATDGSCFQIRTRGPRSHGIGIGIFIAAGPDTGDIEYRIDRGDWHKQELFTQWSPNLHLPWAKMLASELTNGTHELELRVSQEADERSKGHSIRITHFLVNEPK